MMHIGIVSEGPTDYIILKKVIDKITGEENFYLPLQPEPTLTGEYGNGWKGVWKWCIDNAAIKDQLMKNVEPVLDLLIIQMDGDVSRKEKAAHCFCISTLCEYKGKRNPMECDINRETREACPVVLPCADHEESVDGYIDHIESLISSWIGNLSNICIAVPCDSTDAWVVAAYDRICGIEGIEDPWSNIIAKKSKYHNIRIPGRKKRQRLFDQFADKVCCHWEDVTELCESAKKFQDSIISLIQYKSKEINSMAK